MRLENSTGNSGVIRGMKPDRTELMVVILVGYSSLVGTAFCFSRSKKPNSWTYIALRTKDNFTWYEPPSIERRSNAAIMPAAAKYPVMRYAK